MESQTFIYDNKPGWNAPKQYNHYSDDDDDGGNKTSIPHHTTPHHSAVYVHASNILQLFITESYTQSEHKRAQKQSANTILAWINHE